MSSFVSMSQFHSQNAYSPEEVYLWSPSPPPHQKSWTSLPPRALESGIDTPIPSPLAVLFPSKFAFSVLWVQKMFGDLLASLLIRKHLGVPFTYLPPIPYLDNGIQISKFISKFTSLSVPLATLAAFNLESVHTDGWSAELPAPSLRVGSPVLHRSINQFSCVDWPHFDKNYARHLHVQSPVYILICPDQLTLISSCPPNW